MKTTPSAFLCSLSLFLAACCGTAASHSARPVDPALLQEIRRTSADWDRLYNSANVPALAALYAPDAVSMPPNLPTLTGRAALLADFQTFFAENTARHQTTIDDIVMDGTLAIERAHYRLAYKPKTGGAEVVETGRHLECRRKIDGTWQIVLEIWNVDTPLPK